jgi:hypothetical protein
MHRNVGPSGSTFPLGKTEQLYALLNLSCNILIFLDFLNTGSSGRIGDVPMSNPWLTREERARFLRSVTNRNNDIESSVLELIPRFAAGAARIEMIVVPQ